MTTIAIDASRAAGEEKTGVGWYSYYLLQHLKDVVPHDVRVLLYSDRPLPGELRPWPVRWEERVLAWRGSFWSQVRLAAQVLRDRPDVLFVPAHVIPEIISWIRTLAGPAAPRLVTTIHDVDFRACPELYRSRSRWYLEHAARLAVRTADRIIVPTQHVACDLERWYGRSDGVVVIPHGVDAQSTNISSGGDQHSPFVLFVGRLERKKNVLRMVRAFELVAEQHPDLRLVLAGGPGYGYEEIRDAIVRSPYRGRVETLGWVTGEEYHRLLGSASLFLFPTLREGFGLPILEAFAAGVPVVTSIGGAHEEVAGGAAVLVDPRDPSAIARAVAHVLTDANTRAELVERGRQRAAACTWERSARATWDVLAGVLSA